MVFKLLMEHEIINFLINIILSILFSLARWATIEIPSNSQPKLSIAAGEWAVIKRTPCNSA